MHASTASSNGDGRPPARHPESGEHDLAHDRADASAPTLATGMVVMAQTYPLAAFALAGLAGYVAARLLARR